MVDVTSRVGQITVLLERHPALSNLTVHEAREDGFVTFGADVEVPLPSRAAIKGISATGVRAAEPCILRFLPEWPVKGPRVFLRSDFPLNLPHINPYRKGQLISPCLFEGKIDEVFNRFGIDGVLDQLVDWLAKAAAGILIDLNQGWEATRRDNAEGVLVFDAEALGAIIVADEPITAYPVTFAAREGYFQGEVRQLDKADPGQFKQETRTRTLKDQSWSEGITLALVARAPEVDGQIKICDEYFPDTAVDLPSLLDMGARLGINRKELEKAVRSYFRDQDMIRLDAAKERELFAAVILVARRPANLINAKGRSVEFLPYFVRYTGNVTDNRITVHSLWHAQTTSKPILQRAAGFEGINTDQPIIIAGCGSLGSKIALHLGRSGFGNMTFIDDDGMVPHNMARHALLVQDFSLPFSKASLMQLAFQVLSHMVTRDYDGDFTKALSQEGDFEIIGGAQATLIIDATASLAVLTAETVSPLLDASPARLVRTLMYGQGRCAVLFIEGAGRTCRVDDLAAALFNICRTDPALRDAVGGGNSDPVRLLIGDNCSSITTPMSDSVISRGASMISMRIEQLLRDGMDAHGTLCFGVADRSGIGAIWREVPLGPTQVLACITGSGWTIRVLDHVVQGLDSEAQRCGELETGGALIGHVVAATKTIVIGGLVDAPEDSVRERTRFVLGTTGLITALQEAHITSIGHLHFVGTWHSHPMGGTHSGLDFETLAQIAQFSPGLPMVSLVWTPAGMFCAVK